MLDRCLSMQKWLTMTLYDSYGDDRMLIKGLFVAAAVVARFSVCGNARSL
jgi:hypothetical protein